eukprot:gene19642-26328_t
MAKFSVVKDSGAELAFDVENVDVCVVNGIRRSVMLTIPVVAIRFMPHMPEDNDVRFIKNTTSLNNEFVGHRLSLVPICFSAEETSAYQKNNYKFVIKEKNTGDTTIDITTEHIKIYNERGEQCPKELHARLFPTDRVTNDHIKLKPNNYDTENGEEIHLEAFESIGTAKEWAGFSPVSLNTYQFVVDEARAASEYANAEQEFKTLYPEALPSQVEALRKDFDALHRQKHFYKNANGQPSKISYTMESVCGYRCTELVTKAFEYLLEQLNVVRNGVVDISVVQSSSPAIEAISVSGINHTIGNLIQGVLYELFVTLDGAPISFIVRNFTMSMVLVISCHLLLECTRLDGASPIREPIPAKTVAPKTTMEQDDPVEL